MPRTRRLRARTRVVHTDRAARRSPRMLRLCKSVRHYARERPAERASRGAAGLNLRFPRRHVFTALLQQGRSIIPRGCACFETNALVRGQYCGRRQKVCLGSEAATNHRVLWSLNCPRRRARGHFDHDVALAMRVVAALAALTL